MESGPRRTDRPVPPYRVGGPVRVLTPRAAPRKELSRRQRAINQVRAQAKAYGTTFGSTALPVTPQALHAYQLLSRVPASNQAGFKPCERMRVRWPTRACLTIDPRAVTSLALVNAHCPALAAYASKLPIMAVNVGRLLATIEAFAAFATTPLGSSVGSGELNPQRLPANPGYDWCAVRTSADRALWFLVATDIKYAHGPAELRYPPNERFSALLHRLRSSGYEEYFFDLGRALYATVDFVYGDVNRASMFRYTPVAPAQPPQGGRRRPSRKVPSPRLRILVMTDDTAVWAIKTSRFTSVGAHTSAID